MAKSSEDSGKTKVARRNFPSDSLEEALAVPRKILDDRAGQPYHRLLLAESLGIKPSSTNFRDLLSSSFKYGLTDGTEKATEISLTELGRAAAQSDDASKRRAALRQAAFRPQLFADFYTQYKNNKLPSPELIARILTTNFEVPEGYAAECAARIVENGRLAGVIRDVSGSAYVLWDADIESELAHPEPNVDAESDVPTQAAQLDDATTGILAEPNGKEAQSALASTASESPPSVPPSHHPRAIFIGHGKNRGPLEKLEKILRSFDTPFKVAMDEANRGRPIPQKVKDTMLECGSAILIFTRDEKFQNAAGNEVWRPSENVVHELGAASFAYEDRVVIFKEEGIHFPTNYSSIGYIEFEEDNIEAKTMELFKELREFGLIRITTA